MSLKELKVTTKKNITKSEFEKRTEAIVLEKDNVINDLKKQIEDLNLKLSKYELGEVVIAKDDDIKKKILSFRAQSMNIVQIKNKLIELGIDYSIEQVDVLINNIDLLSADLQLYYETEQQAFEEKIKINPNILKQALLNDNQFLMDKARVMIDIAEKSQDGETMGKYMDRYDKYQNTRTKLLSDVVIDKEESSVDNNLEQLKESIGNLSKKVVKFDFGNNKIRSL